MTTKSMLCVTCSEPFEMAVRRGSDRRYCSRDCMFEYRKRKAIAGQCTADGCTRQAKHRSDVGHLCHACYSQWTRTGGVLRNPKRYRSEQRRGYVLLQQPEHPLAHKYGQVYEHRAVAWEVTDGVCQPCYWCGTALEWASVVIDHKNELKNDNRPGNLLFSCGPCNTARGSILPFLHRVSADRLEHAIELMRAYHASQHMTTEHRASAKSAASQVQ